MNNGVAVSVVLCSVQRTNKLKRMHSSRMRTARPLTVERGGGRCCCPGGEGGAVVQGGREVLLSRGEGGAVVQRGGEVL